MQTVTVYKDHSSVEVWEKCREATRDLDPNHWRTETWRIREQAKDRWYKSHGARKHEGVCVEKLKYIPALTGQSTMDTRLFS